MARGLDIERWKDELVTAVRFGEADRIRVLVGQPGPRKARALLESLLESETGLMRQAAALGLGELGGSSSARRLEQQLEREQARGDLEGSAVAEAITQVLGYLQDAGTRATLVRRLQRLVASKADLSDVNHVARMLWHHRHPDLLPPIRLAWQQLAPTGLNSLHGLLVLLEKSPEDLHAWVEDVSVPVEHKTHVLTVLEEEVPEAWLPTLGAFISLAQALLDTTAAQEAPAASYCDHLFTLLLLHREHVLPRLSGASRATLHAVTRRGVASRSLSCALRAASLLEFIGQPEDVPLLEAHRPEDATFAAVFNEVAQVLRRRQ